MNFIEIMGHLGADPEVRYTPSGQKIVTLRVATNVRKGGKDMTVWWRVTIWGERFDKMLPYFKKGSAVIVMGELQKPEIYVDRNGVSQVSLDITAELIRFSPFGRTGQEGAVGGEEMGSSPRTSSSGAFSMNPAQDLQGQQLDYPHMGYEDTMEAPRKGQGSSKGSVHTEDNIPF